MAVEYRKKKGVLLDLDGTLIDSHASPLSLLERDARVIWYQS